MNCRIGLCLVVAIVMAASMAEAGVRDLRNKYRHLIGGDGGMISSGGGSAAASAAAGANGVSSSVAMATGGANGYRYGPPGGYVPEPSVQHHYYQQPQYQPRHHQYRPQQTPMIRRPAPGYYETEGGLVEPVAQFPYGGQHAAAPAAAYGYQEPSRFRFAPQHHNQHQHQHQHQHPHHHNGHHQQHPQHYVESQRGPVYQPGAATSSAAAAVSGGHHGGSAAAASAASGVSASAAGSFHAPEHNHHTVDREELNQQYYEPETVDHYEAKAGTFNDNAGGTLEEGSYVRDTETVEKHEDGREDGDHYYNAHAYGKSGDVNKYTAYNNGDEDILHTPNVYRKKKSNTNFVSNFNKQHRETGSGVIAHDKHSAMFNKNTKKVKENVDQRYSKAGEGLTETKNFNSKTDIDDEDEEAMDSRGLGNFVGVDGVAHARRPDFGTSVAAASAAAAAASATVAAAHH